MSSKRLSSARMMSVLSLALPELTPTVVALTDESVTPANDDVELDVDLYHTTFTITNDELDEYAFEANIVDKELTIAVDVFPPGSTLPKPIILGILNKLIDLELKHISQCNKHSYDISFKSMIKKAYNEFDDAQIVCKNKDVPITVYTILLVHRLKEYTLNGTFAFSIGQIIDGIKVSHPKIKTTLSDLLKIASTIEADKYSLKDIPFTAYVVNFNYLTSTFLQRELMLNKPNIYINGGSTDLQSKNVVMMLQFGKKHVAMVNMINANKYKLFRINHEAYKVKSIKRELNIK